MCPLHAHSVYKPFRAKIDGQTMCPCCAHYVPTIHPVTLAGRKQWARTEVLMWPVCAFYVSTMWSKPGGWGAMSLQGAPYVSTMCPVCVHYLSKLLWGQIDGRTVCPVNAH